ncbi:MAG TPA: hypothetical protein VNS09_11485 [Solirubrobacter sp.]|nr:hypothetical protein [Solirubrobacter sp.]
MASNFDDDELAVYSGDVRALADLGITHPTGDREAVARIQAALLRRDGRHRVRRRLRRSGRMLGRRGLVVGLAALAATGTAAAAVVTVVTRDSEPARGVIPPLSASGQSPGDYTVRFEPDLRAGRIGWCTLVTLARHSGELAGAESCFGAASGQRPLIAAGGVMTNDPAQRSVQYVIVDQRVAAVRSGTERVIPRPDSALPEGWRIAILTPQGGADGAFELESTDGAEMPLEKLPGTVTAKLPTSPADSSTSEPQPCAIRLSAADAKRATAARHLTSPLKPTPDLNGHPYLTCATVKVESSHGIVEVSLLLDARDPTAHVADLPGVHQASGIVRLDAQTIARRDGDAWLVARGQNSEDSINVLKHASAEAKPLSTTAPSATPTHQPRPRRRSMGATSASR